MGSKVSACIKAVKVWIAANKVTAGILAGVIVAGGGAAVALGAGILPQPAAAETEAETQAEFPDNAQNIVLDNELSSEDLEAVYEPNLLRGSLMGEPLLEELWESLESVYGQKTTTKAAATEEESTTKEEEKETTTEKEKIEIPPVVVAPVNDKEDSQPQDDSNKGSSEQLDIEEVIEQEKEKEEEKEEAGEYENVSRSYGIDVSKWQYSIDWSKVAASGVEFAIIRVGYRGNKTGDIVMDPYFERNIKGALANNIKVGVYFYSQAIDEEEAKQEAAWVVNVIQKYQITYPVVYDCEGLGQNRIKDVGKTQRSKNAAAFLDYIRSSGYTPMMYASKYGYTKNWDLSYIKNSKIWLAHYTSGGLSTPSDYSGTYHMWQYTSKGRVPGIKGDVDLNVAYFSYSHTPDPVVGTVSYSVLDENSQPVPGATVSMKGTNTRRTLTAETGENGVAVFNNVVVDDYEVSVSAMPDGYQRTADSKVQVSFGKAESSYEGRLLVAHVRASVSCDVIDMNGAPVKGVTVALSGTAKNGEKVEQSAETNESGKAEFKDVPLGSYEIYTVKAPEGYKLLAQPKKEAVEVTSASAVNVASKLTVEKTEVPSESTTPESPDDTTAPSSPSSSEGTTPEETTTKAPEDTTPAETTTRAPEGTTQEETTTRAPEGTTQEETTTKAPEDTTPAETTTKAPEDTTPAQTATEELTTTAKPEATMESVEATQAESRTTAEQSADSPLESDEGTTPGMASLEDGIDSGEAAE